MPRTNSDSSRDTSPNAVIHTLRLLAEESADLGLSRTYLAICQVMLICEAECAPEWPSAPPLIQ